MVSQLSQMNDLVGFQPDQGDTALKNVLNQSTHSCSGENCGIVALRGKINAEKMSNRLPVCGVCIVSVCMHTLNDYSNAVCSIST